MGRAGRRRVRLDPTRRMDVVNHGDPSVGGTVCFICTMKDVVPPSFPERRTISPFLVRAQADHHP